MLSPISLANFNELPADEKTAGLLSCSNCAPWAAAMVAQGQFRSVRQLSRAAAHHWFALSHDEWKQAFEATHPRIGESPAAHAGLSETAVAWSSAEQAGMATATASVVEQIAAGNAVYEERFGYRFIIRAAGRSAEEKLAALQRRLQNDPDAELDVAAEQYNEITVLRLQNWITS